MSKSSKKPRAPLNRTLVLSPAEYSIYKEKLIKLTGPVNENKIENRIIHQDLFEILDYLPFNFVDLLFVDPPYNLTKNFSSTRFRQMKIQDYAGWLDSWISKMIRMMKKTASIYICGDWRSSGAIQEILDRYFMIRNRITWERDKGRGAKSNWKNCSEDIWYCTMTDEYLFNLDAVRLKKKVLAPYKDSKGKPKDWSKSKYGKFRLTHPSNLWTDLTVPYWSMRENTDHPTQKPEKLLAKIILASSRPGDLIFDPFSGSGTTAVVAKKLNRRYLGIEMDETYCCLAEKRLVLAEKDNTIQGYKDGIFWERNTLLEQNNKK